VRIFLLTIFFISGIKTLAFANPDTLNVFRFEELRFDSSLEKEAFQCFYSGQKCDPFHLALATDPNISLPDYEGFKKDFYGYLDELKQNKRFTRKPRVQIAFIFKAIHGKYLRLYKETPLFSQIFITNDFNCLTATVLYALAFDYLDIPYQNILLTDHVYLIAYPGELSIIVETTNPLRGTRTAIGIREKARAVQSLLNMKLITEQDIQQKGVEQVFNEFYLAEDTPELIQLIGSLYYNYAMVEADRLRYMQAYELLKKSSFLYPRRNTTSFLMIFAATILTGADIKHKETYRVFSDLEKFMAFGISRQAIIDQSHSYLDMAKKSGQHQLIDSAYLWMYQDFNDSIIKDELKFTYHFNKTLRLLSNYWDNEALEYLEITYRMRPFDDNVNTLMMQFLSKKLQSGWSIESNYHSVKEFAERFESLPENQNFLMLYQITLLETIDHHFLSRNFDSAEKFRKEFEQKFSPESIASSEILGYFEQVYSRASLLYYHEKRISRAREVLTSGLKYAPNSYELNSKLNQLR
jgi:hypothetical protein